MKSFFKKITEFAQNNQLAIATGNIMLSYGDLLHKVIAGANFLQKNHIGSSTTVGVFIKDETEHLVATLSLLLIGAKKITLASHDSSKNHSELIEQVGINFILTTSKAFIQDFPQSVFWDPSYSAEFDNFNHAFLDNGCIFLRTSGTTGKPNILEFTQEQLALQSIRHPEYVNERLLRLASLEHNNSIRHRLYCLYMGGVNVFYDKNIDPDLLEFIDKCAVTCLDVSRMHLDNLTRLYHQKELNHVKIRTGGSALPYSLRSKVIQSVSEKLYVRYATSETGGISMANPNDHDSDECSGRPLQDVQIRIVDSNNQPLPNGSIGKIGMLIPGMVREYFKNPEQSAARFRDGWFYPGDVGFIRKDGCIVVLAREDETIIMNGLNIFPKEIEEVLESHPDVANAVAVGIESRVHGCIPVAAVVLNPGAKSTPNDLLIWAKQLLALKSPKKIIFIDHIPKSPQGKIMRREVLDYFGVSSNKS